MEKLTHDKQEEYSLNESTDETTICWKCSTPKPNSEFIKLDVTTPICNTCINEFKERLKD